MKSVGVVLVFLLIFLRFNQSVSKCCNRTRRAIKKHPTFDSFPPEAFMTVSDVIRYNGYPAESHIVQTEDGYILTMHRVLRGRDHKDDGQRPAVLLQHGILFSSAAWVLMGRENSLAFILADAGYDVWMGNLRGNIYSKAHVKKEVSSFEFWDFSWHEMAQYDLPAEIDYVLKMTGHQDLMYIGHSTGANIFYIMCALRPEYNSKISAQFSLAPDSILDRTSTTMDKVGRFIQSMTGMLMSSNINEVVTNFKEKHLISASFCTDKRTSRICNGVLQLLGGFRINPYDQKTLALIFSHFPAGTSRKTIWHYAQCVQLGKYANINYYALNYFVYKNRSPPEYNLTLVTVPVYFYYAVKDVISSEMEARTLHDLFPNSRGLYKVPSEKFYHLDFLWGSHTRVLLFNQLLTQMEESQKIPKNSSSTEKHGRNLFGQDIEINLFPLPSPKPHIKGDKKDAKE